MRHREQCAMSNARAGYGSLFFARTPSMAGRPLSSANCTCASWPSRGARDMVCTLRLSKKAPKLPT